MDADLFSYGISNADVCVDSDIWKNQRILIV
jgi:hypothetical protein